MEKEFNELFPPSQNNESELLEHSYLINYRELLLSHLKPELLKRFIQIKQNVTFKNFLEAAQYPPKPPGPFDNIPTFKSILSITPFAT